MIALKLTQIGNSVGVVLPKEALAKLGVEKGDVIYLTEAPGGDLRISAYNAEVAEEVAIGERFMDRYRDTFALLQSDGRARWITKDALLILHDRSLALHGGAAGLRDEGLLKSALARPQNRYHYEGVDDLVELSATYAASVSANHPFADGNKRAALLAAGLFLEKHGLTIIAGQAETAAMILALAAGEVDIPRLTAWLRANVRPADRPGPSGA